MNDAATARWGVLLAAFALACQRPGNEASSNRAGESAPRKPQAVLDRDGAPHEVGIASAAQNEPAVAGLRPIELTGGRWVSCYANYRPTSTPERDVARLAASCGPENGMVPVGPIAGGEAVDGAEDHRLDAEAGDCFRIFAVADPFVADLGIEVIGPRGAITWDRNGDRWPILDSDGPFCLFDAGVYTVRVRALQGKGRYALQVWRIP